MDRKESDPDASSQSSKAPSVDLVVYSRKRKRGQPNGTSTTKSPPPPVDLVVYSRKRKRGQPNGASTTKSPPPPVDLVVYSRKRKRGQPNGTSTTKSPPPPVDMLVKCPPGPDVASTFKSPPGTSLIVWDLQLHTTDGDLLETFKSIAVPSDFRFISLRNYRGKYSHCCRLEMRSVEEAHLILAKSPYLINGIHVRVAAALDTDSYERGGYKFKILGIQKPLKNGTEKPFKNGIEAWQFMRQLFQKYDCGHIEIIKAKGRLEKLEGTVILRFRTHLGKLRALKFVKTIPQFTRYGWKLRDLRPSRHLR